jgi:hypothetical protein
MLLLRAEVRPPSPATTVHSVTRGSLLALVVLAALIGSASLAEASPKRTKGSTKASKASAKASPGPSNAAVSGAKVAILPFEGDDAEPLRKHVIKIFVERGITVNSTLKAQDNPTQYRDMGAALDLAVYIHGKIKDTSPEHAVATVTIRSAVTGRPVASATFNGFRRGLPFDVEEKLWEKVHTAFARACMDASKPRHHNEFTHIEAGTPL